MAWFFVEYITVNDSINYLLFTNKEDTWTWCAYICLHIQCVYDSIVRDMSGIVDQ